VLSANVFDLNTVDVSLVRKFEFLHCIRRSLSYICRVSTILQHSIAVILLLMLFGHMCNQVFNMESEYNMKNRQRMLPVDDRPLWEDVFGVGKVYAVSTGRVCHVK